MEPLIEVKNLSVHFASAGTGRIRGEKRLLRHQEGRNGCACR